MTEPRRRPLLRRMATIVVALSAATLLQRMFGTQPVELLVAVPPEVDDGSGIDLRLTHPNESKLVLQVLEKTRAPGGHSIVVRTKLPKGRYHVQAWLENTAHSAFVGDFAFDGEEAVDVKLVPR